MSEPEFSDGPTPAEVAAAARLAHSKQVTMERIVSHMSGVGASIVNSYPMAEVQSWALQRSEADIVIEFGEVAVAASTVPVLQQLAPFLVSVCVAQFGPVENDNKRAAQLWAKAHQVKANADLWAGLSAFVNGLRAKAADRIAAAQSEADVFEIESGTQTELSQFRAQYGV